MAGSRFSPCHLLPLFRSNFTCRRCALSCGVPAAPMERAEELLKPIRAFRAPAVDFAGPISWPVLQSLFDALYPAGLQWYWKADFFKDLSDKAIDLHMKYGSQLPTMYSTMHIYPINGAVHRASTSDTAFSFRDANFAEVIVGVDPDPTNNERMIQWARDYWMALHPYSAGGGYVNMMMDEGADNVKAAYRDNYARLAQVKAKYDPSNLFHVNHNIRQPGDAARERDGWRKTMSSKQLAQITFDRHHAVVIGGSMAGLLAARVLSDHFEQVTMIERDTLTSEFKPRKGVPQGRHVHGLLARGVVIMGEYFPDLFPTLAQDGAILGRHGRCTLESARRLDDARS